MKYTNKQHDDTRTACIDLNLTPPPLLPPPLLPTEGAAEVAVTRPASQAAGAEDVVAVQQTRTLVLLAAQVTHQRVDVGAVHVAQVAQVGEDSSGHLRIPTA